MRDAQRTPSPAKAVFKRYSLNGKEIPECPPSGVCWINLSDERARVTSVIGPASPRCMCLAAYGWPHPPLLYSSPVSTQYPLTPYPWPKPLILRDLTQKPRRKPALLLLFSVAVALDTCSCLPCVFYHRSRWQFPGTALLCSYMHMVTDICDIYQFAVFNKV